jgi:fructose transport system permease protein
VPNGVKVGEEAARAPATTGRRRQIEISELVLRYPALGPTCALVLAVVIFSVATNTFFSLDNFSLVVEQSLVVGTLALGQTLIILSAGIDLANGAIMVFGTLLMAKLAGGGGLGALLAGIVLCMALGAISGGLVTSLRLPPFIVTLGMLTVVAASSRIFAAGQSFPVNNARLTGIHVNRTLFSVYLLAGVIYGFAAWQAIGRIPNADPNAYQTGNLDSITAVVIGGTSLFGGRGGVLGTLVGALIVSVLRSGLTQAGIDELYQDVATGLLVIAAVALDQLARRRSR